ncbi:sodium:proton antiporter NhaD [Desulfotalea psychrophila]|uniref:Probable Na+/H+ antiporter (NhaD family) n=1 Tax=Desulfotalea psychrophila (strain LSv54 / DSM 12343) TaxID=177439 RepID=Q6APZ6_DESPS|nr:sodium:proton antiporter NhaD [Desulfotalea psychrophila]CAG35577.1 probable Na+/H+ antiporter (NhaD family) [Desulfotalea psychrophila LSv54]
MKKVLGLTGLFLAMATPLFASAGAAAGAHPDTHSLVGSSLGIFSVLLFVGAYSLVIFEEQLHLRKSKPVLLAAGIIWVCVAVTFKAMGYDHAAETAIRHNILEYAELLLFLLVAMTYINTMDERNVFQALRSWLVSRGLSLRAVFWITGFLAFVISPVADNLTTALLMGAVAMAVGGKNKKFVVVACINIVIAANAGGAFSPFGDITTLMVWQKGVVQFQEFFVLFLPSLVNWLVPAFFMNFAIGKGIPEASDEHYPMKFGAIRIIFLFLATIITAVSFHNFLGLPPAAGMMLGLGYLGLFSYYIKKREQKSIAIDDNPLSQETHHAKTDPFDLFKKIARAEWDTLLFFYGVILCVGGLSQFGYLALISQFLYLDLGPTYANVIVGMLSAIVDNIPVMFAVLTMMPEMSHGQWLLVTLTAGVGGSLLSIGSAAGVALMGSARGVYTFAAHLKWTPVIALGYAASIVTHLWVNSHYMEVFM